MSMHQRTRFVVHYHASAQWLSLYHSRVMGLYESGSEGLYESGIKLKLKWKGQSVGIPSIIEASQCSGRPEGMGKLGFYKSRTTWQRLPWPHLQRSRVTWRWLLWWKLHRSLRHVVRLLCKCGKRSLCYVIRLLCKCGKTSLRHVWRVPNFFIIFLLIQNNFKNV